MFSGHPVFLRNSRVTLIKDFPAGLMMMLSLINLDRNDD
jgi:hypothetical protein